MGSGIPLPGYYRYDTLPAKMLRTPDGGIELWIFDLQTGGWKPGNEFIDDILFASGGDNNTFHYLDKNDFIYKVESERVHNRRRWIEGEIAAIYATVNAMVEKIAAERRMATPVEGALIKGLQRETYPMYEAELAKRGDPGADVEAAREAGLLPDTDDDPTGSSSR